MALNIISNYAANVAHRNLTASDSEATSSVAKLSAGKRVLAAKDDAASLAIGSRLSAEVAGLKQAGVNAGQASSMLQIADGAMDKVNDILTRMKTLAIQSGSGQLSDTERGMLDTEFQALRDEIDRIAEDTEFNGTQLVNGSIDVELTGSSAFDQADGVASIDMRGVDYGTNASGTVSLTYDGTDTFIVTDNAGNTFSGQIDADALDTNGALVQSTVVELDGGTLGSATLQLGTGFDSANSVAAETMTLSGSTELSLDFKVGTGVDATADEISIDVNSITVSALGLSGQQIDTQDNADSASTALSSAIDSLQEFRANVGASQNRLDFAAANIATSQENQEAARSQLMDLDVAQEMSKFTSKQILVQAGTSMLAQANQLPQNLLSLFR
jgi:flagellin